MKKYLVCSLLAVAVALSSSTFAEDGAAKPAKAEKAQKPDGPKTSQFTGEITAVDAKANSLTVKHSTKDESKTFKAEGAKVATVDKKDATLADLKVGDKVRVQFVEENGAAVAKKIGPVPFRKPKAEKKAEGEKKAE
jgi:Cu/Ag efflux protein CusF